MKYLLILICALWMIQFSGCHHAKKQPEAKENKIIMEYYTCPFHTDITRADSGKCPKCGRKLVKIVKKLTDSNQKQEE